MDLAQSIDSENTQNSEFHKEVREWQDWKQDDITTGLVNRWSNKKMEDLQDYIYTHGLKGQVGTIRTGQTGGKSR